MIYKHLCSIIEKENLYKIIQYLKDNKINYKLKGSEFKGYSLFIEKPTEDLFNKVRVLK